MRTPPLLVIVADAPPAAYTSLLRITTTPPDLKAVRDSEDGAEPAAEQDITAADRPSFLRSLSRAFVPAPGPALAEVPAHIV